MMGFFRNAKIKAHAARATARMMAVGSQSRKSDPDSGPNAMELMEMIGDQLAIMARDSGLDENERLAVVRGMRQAMEMERLSHTARESIIAHLLTFE